MVTIRAATQIHAPIERCFRLSVSVDLQRAATGQEPSDGVTTGLLGPGDTVTWRGPGGRHQTLIEVWRPYSYFREVMLAGPFKAYEHEHHFATMNDGTRIRDEIRFTARLGLLGRLVQWISRRRVLRLIEKRNAFLKRVAESDEWSQYMEGQPELDLRTYQAMSAFAPADRDTPLRRNSTSSSRLKVLN
jgi:ligand-binding SRPBCC domain-containing protein